MVNDGLPLEEAANLAGMKPHSLTQALRKPHVRQFREALRHAYLRFQGEQAVSVIADLMVEAKSESVRLEAAKAMCDLAGIKPAAVVEHKHTGQVQGYLVALDSPEPRSIGGRVIDMEETSPEAEEDAAA